MAIGARIAHLDAVHVREVFKLALTRTAWSALVMVMAFVLADLLFAFGDMLRVLLDLTLLVALIVVCCICYLSQRRSKSPGRMVARMVETGNPSLRNTLINAIDFEEELVGSSRDGVSIELMKTEISSATEDIEHLPDLSALRPASLTKELNVLKMLLVLAVVLAAVFHNVSLTIFPRFVYPFGDFPPYSGTTFEVEPAGATVDYGENLKVTVVASGRIPTSVSLVLRELNGEETVEFPMFDAGDGVFFQTIENVREDYEYFARIRRGRSKRYKLALVRLPRVQDVIVTYTYPEYTRMSPETRVLTDNEFRGYAGTEVALAIASNRPLQGGNITVCGESYSLETRDTHTVSATFSITRAGDFSATITDVEGYGSKDPLIGKVEIIPDEKPEVTIASPGMDSFAVPDAKIPIVVEASDDLGIIRIDIYRNHNSSDDARKPLYREEGDDRIVSVIETFDLEDLGVRPGDVIDYYVTATDSLPDRPQTASSQAFRLQIISFEEYREFMQMQMTAADLKEKYDAILDELTALAEEQKRLQKETDALEQKLEQTGSLSEEERQRLEQARDEQNKLAELARELGEKLEQEAGTPGIYDIEKDYKEVLREFAERLAKAREHMQNAQEQLGNAAAAASESSPNAPSPKVGPALAQASDEQMQALEALGQIAQDFQEGIQKANENLERVADVMGDVEMFKYLYTLQKSLERQVRSYKDMKDPNLDDQIRLKELSEEQNTVEQALSELKESLRQHADDLDELAKSMHEPTESDMIERSSGAVTEEGSQ